MTFLLSKDGRNEDFAGCFARYKAYLQENKDKFPVSAFELANSVWYSDASDHRCPHDAWLESLQLSEQSHGDRSELRYSTIKIRLLAPYHDGFIELTYPKVFSYRITAYNCLRGHLDWRYEEFRLSDNGQIIHEIEWASDDDGVWLIEASDVLYQWVPRAEAHSR